MFKWIKSKKPRKRTSSVTKHYIQHKEAARQLIIERLQHHNQHYNLQWNRVAIRNQRRCWGSCSSKKNLNFNYKILFLPPHLQDYIVVHEMCHLVHLNHGADFWSLVCEKLPSAKQHSRELRHFDMTQQKADYK